MGKISMKSDTRTARDRLDRILAIAGRATRFWAAALAVIIVGGALSVAFAFTRPRVYKSETLILYREGIRSSDLGGPDSIGGDPARKLGLKLKEMVLSRTRLQQIIDEFKLYPEVVADRGYVDAVDEMRNHISFRVKDGDTFGLSFEGEDAKRVQLVTARLAEALISENSKTRAEQAEVTKEFLDAEKQRTEGELRDKETALAKFLVKHPEFAKENSAQTGQAGTAIRAAQSSGKPKGDPTLLALEREATRIQERLGMPVARKREKETIDPRLLAERQAAEADLKAAQKDLENKLLQFTEQHPDVKQAKGHVRTAEARLKAAIDAIAEGAAAAQRKDAADEANEGTIDRAALENELKRVNDEITAYKNKKRRQDGAEPAAGSGSWIVALETDWTRLNREVGEARERYQQLQDKQFKASMAETAAVSGRNANMEIVDPAYKPTHPAKPSRSLIAAVGVLVAFGLALALALGCALLDDRLYDRVDVERLELAPLLGLVPRAEKSSRREAAHG
jgi:uncharacterized protein involved in exopolysaccharide biosynthesis